MMAEHAKGTWKAFKKFTGISRETLIYDHDPEAQLGITPENEKKLAEKYKFKPKCETWLNGTPNEFVDRWFDEGRMRLKSVTIRNQTIDDEGQSIYVQLFYRRNDNSDLATFDAELVAQSFTPQGMDRRVRLAIEYATLVVTCPHHLVAPIADRLGGKDGGVVYVERAANSLSIRPRGRTQMLWEITADKAPIGVVANELVGLFAVGGVKAGDEFEILLRVDVSDLVTADRPSDLPQGFRTSD